MDWGFPQSFFLFYERKLSLIFKDIYKHRLTKLTLVN